MAAEGTSESGFEIDGERYSVPTLDTITLDEERLLYIYADAVVADFIPIHPDWDEEAAAAHLTMQARRIRNPDFKRALAHIAYRRRHTEIPDAEIQELLGPVSALEINVAMLVGEDELAEDPPTSSPSELDESSGKSELGSSTAFGSPTPTPSDPPASTPGDIGTGESDTSSPPLLRTVSGS